MFHNIKIRTAKVGKHLGIRLEERTIFIPHFRKKEPQLKIKGHIFGRF